MPEYEDVAKMKELCVDATGQHIEMAFRFFYNEMHSSSSCWHISFHFVFSKLVAERQF